MRYLLKTSKILIRLSYLLVTEGLRHVGTDVVFGILISTLPGYGSISLIALVDGEEHHHTHSVRMEETDFDRSTN